jgi:hypothetical protein
MQQPVHLLENPCEQLSLLNSSLRPEVEGGEVSRHAQTRGFR